MSSKLKAVGVHMFAGGFARGILDAGWDIDVHLETHGFALDTARALCGVDIINDENARWPERRPEGIMAAGNPRCTAFSMVTSGSRYADSNAHGAWAKQTCDIQQMVHYTAGYYDFVVWESVQQAHTVGRDLVDWMVREHFAPKGYRIAHLFLNAASFGNTQQRKRYFFVAYRDCYKFNVQPPPILPYYGTLYDAIHEYTDRPTRACAFNRDDEDYDFDCYSPLSENDVEVIRVLPNGWSHNGLARWGYHLLTDRDKTIWNMRSSDMPFSLHSLRRLQWCRPSPTLTSSSSRWVHPDHDRTLTVGELAAMMGWPRIPVGLRPIAQMAKGVVPCVGEWLARQVQLSYETHWGSDDWETSFNDKTATWEGQSAERAVEKTLDMTKYCGKLFDEERHSDVLVPRHRHNVDENGRLIRPWKELATGAQR